MVEKIQRLHSIMRALAKPLKVGSEEREKTLAEVLDAVDDLEIDKDLKSLGKLQASISKLLPREYDSEYCLMACASARKRVKKEI